MRPDRRTLLAGSAALAATGLLPRPVQAQSGFGPPRHGFSAFGDLAYGPDATHFAYVNPDAPKGGSVALQISRTQGNQAFDTFNTLNIYVLKGDGAAGMNLTFASLMTRALDEPDAVYGLAAESVALSEDGLVQRYRMRPQARFHDGSPLTAADAAFSILTLKTKGHPLFAQVLRMVEAATALDPATLEVRYAPGRSRDLPLVVAQLPIFSQAYYTRKPFEEASLEAPLGSGPYRVARFEQGRFIEFERVADWWGATLPAMRGSWNFDRLRYEYFRDRQVALEAFKAATVTLREEFTSRDWATGYDFPAVRDGRVKREELPDATPSGTQGWFFNTRREKFSDRRVREALGLLFDFEWTNANIMYGAYRRTASFFENSPMKAEGVPSAEELALLEPLRAMVPAEVFGMPFVPPVSDGSGQDRALLRRADELLRQAGCRREGQVLRLPSGQPFEIELLDFSPSLQPHSAGLIKNLKLVGIETRSRIVDAAQYQRRTDAFDFDMITRRYSMGPTPGEGLQVMVGSQAARTEGSSNIAGIADPAVDRLVAAVLASDTRAQLVTACRALDRVLRAGRYWIPMWYKGSHWMAVWDMFGRPAIKPTYDRGAPETWWFDAERARRIGRG